MVVMEIEEVLLARIAPAGAAASRSRKMPNFVSGFSVAASMTSSACPVPSSALAVLTRPSVASFCSAVSVPFFT